MDIKRIFQEPILYYIAAPLLVAIWPLVIWQVYLPRATREWQIEQKYYEQARQLMQQILELDSERLDLGKADGKDVFDYTVAVDAAARKVGISATAYTISSKPIRGSGRNKTQECQVIINDIDIVRLSRFLSNIQTTWANLQCEKITLTKKKGLPDAWKVDITFKYYY